MLVPAEEIREKFGYFDIYSVRRAVKRHNIKHEMRDGELLIDRDEFSSYYTGKARNQHDRFQRPEIPTYDKHLVIRADRAVITCDYHAPYYDDDFANVMLDICKKLNVKVHIVAGDLFDQHVFTPFINYETSDWNYEKQIVREIGWTLETHFDEVYYQIGNHDVRVFKRLMGKGDVKAVWDEVFGPDFRDRVSEYPFCHLVSGEREWLIGHPDTARQVPGANPRDLSDKYKGYHIMLAHGHQTASVPDRSGQYRCVEIGGMMLPEAHAYKMRRLNKYPHWTPGFAIIIDGYEYIFQKNHTDWDWWLRQEFK